MAGRRQIFLRSCGKDKRELKIGVDRGMQTINGGKLVRRVKRRWILAASAAQLLVGCSMGNPIMVNSGPGPHAENCAMIQQATPTKYVCNGKVYTSVQLANIRNGGTLTK